MRTPTIRQSHEVIAALASRIEWEKMSAEEIQWLIVHAKELEVTAFLKNRGKLLLEPPGVIAINRAEQLYPKEMLGKSFDVWRGPLDSNGLLGDIAQDARSLALQKLDLRFVELAARMSSEEEGIEMYDRLVDSGYILLDADIFLHLWRNTHLIPPAWKEAAEARSAGISFFGSVFREACEEDARWGSPVVVELVRLENQGWHWRCVPVQATGPSGERCVPIVGA